MTSYEDVVRLLLKVLTMKYDNDNNNFIEYIAVSILNSLACQVDHTEKRTQGDLGAVQVTTQLVVVKYPWICIALYNDSSRDVPDIRLRFWLAGYPAIFCYPVPDPAKILPVTG